MALVCLVGDILRIRTRGTHHFSPPFGEYVVIQPPPGGCLVGYIMKKGAYICLLPDHFFRVHNW